MMPDDMRKGIPRREASTVGGEVAKTVHETEASRRTVRDAAEASAGTASRSLEASREIVRGGEAVSRIASDAADTSQQAAEQFSQMFTGRIGDYQEIFLHVQQNLDVLMQVGGVVVGGLPSIVQEWTGYAQSAVQHNIDGVNSMMRVRSLEDLTSAQSDLMTSQIRLLLNSSVKISEAAARLARDAAQSIDNRTRQAQRR